MRAIDADALIHELNNSHYPGAPYIDAGISIAIGKVCDAPTIEPERKTGKWIHIGGDEWCCDKCGNVITTEGSWEHPISEERKAYYCNICGADMRGEQDD